MGILCLLTSFQMIQMQVVFWKAKAHTHGQAGNRSSQWTAARRRHTNSWDTITVLLVLVVLVMLAVVVVLLYTAVVFILDTSLITVLSVSVSPVFLWLTDWLTEWVSALGPRRGHLREPNDCFLCKWKKHLLCCSPVRLMLLLPPPPWSPLSSTGVVRNVQPDYTHIIFCTFQSVFHA